MKQALSLILGCLCAPSLYATPFTDFDELPPSNPAPYTFVQSGDSDHLHIDISASWEGRHIFDASTSYLQGPFGVISFRGGLDDLRRHAGEPVDPDITIIAHLGGHFFFNQTATGYPDSDLSDAPPLTVFLDSATTSPSGSQSFTGVEQDGYSYSGTFFLSANFFEFVGGTASGYLDISRHPVPDAGSTALLLLCGLGGLTIFRPRRQGGPTGEKV